MAADKNYKPITSSRGGLAASHDAASIFPVFVAPATTGESNMFRVSLFTVACWRIEDARFDFDSSFILPEARTEFSQFAQLRNSHPGCPTSLFGHADPVGNDDYNKILSGRRAAAVYGILIRDPSIWEDLYSNTGKYAQPSPSDKWGEATLRKMNDVIGSSSETGSTTDRKQLFLAYMDLVCVDSSGKPFQLDPKEDFLGQSQDSGWKGDVQGCGEFNPVLIFSSEDNARYEQSSDKTERNDANRSNRRVISLLFRKGSQIVPEKWPCPRVKEGVNGCKKRFWADGEARRSSRLPDQPRRFELTADTFACRFYQRLSTGSPCEQIQTKVSWITRIPKRTKDQLFLLIRDPQGKEVARIKPEQASSGPADNYSFDLSQFDPLVPYILELHDDNVFIAPKFSLTIGTLRASLAQDNTLGAGASLFVAESEAEPASDLDGYETFTSDEPDPPSKA